MIMKEVNGRHVELVFAHCATCKDLSACYSDEDGLPTLMTEQDCAEAPVEKKVAEKLLLYVKEESTIPHMREPEDYNNNY